MLPSGGQLKLQGKLAREICLKFPDASSNSLAKALYEQNPLLYGNVKNARNCVTYHRKERGANKNKGYEIKDPILTTKTHTRENPYGIPQSHEVVRTPYILPKINNNILIISDLHIPYHTTDALECALRYGSDNNVNTIFINGDLLDCYQLSKYETDPKKRSTSNEIEAGKTFLAGLRKAFPTAGIYYHLGNHDLRYELFMIRNKAILEKMFGDADMSLETRLDMINQRIIMIGDKQVTKAGKLSITHGHYIFRGASSPVSPARTMLMKAKQSMVCGHTHKISEATAMNLDGDIYTCFSTGSLCELLPDYTPMCNDYSHGFAHAIIHADNSFTIKNFRIHKGKIL